MGDYSPWGRTESVTAEGLSTHTTMPHSPRVSAHMTLGKKSVTSPEALNFRETRGILPPIGEETAKTSISRSRPSGHTSRAAGAQKEHPDDN